MADRNIISILLTAKDEASKVLATAAGNVTETSNALNDFGKRATAVGDGLSKFVTLPIVGVGVAAVKMAGDFQASMTRLVTSAGESKDNLAAVSAGTLQVARDTGTSTTELAKALYTVESGGQHGADGLTVLKAAAQGAKAENSDLATVADAVTSVLVDYHLTANDAALVTTKLVAATSAGKTTFQELAGAMPDILPVASAAHVALSDILGDLAAMTIHGMSAQQSAQNLADVIRHMQNPTAMQAKELALLNLTTTQLADDMQNKGLSGTLQEISDRIANLMPPGSNKVILDLKTALTNLSPPVQALGVHLFDGTMSAKDYAKAAEALDPISAKQAISFGTLAGATHRIGDQQMTGAAVMQNYGQALAKATGDSTGLNVALMLSGENAGVVNSAIKTVNGATVEAGGNVKGWADIQETFNFKLARFREVLSTSAITLGNDLLPALTTLVDRVANAAKWFEQLDPGQRKFLENTAGVLAIIGPGILILGKFASAIGTIAEVSTGAAKALGLIKTTSVVAEAAAGARALGAAGGLAGAAGEATGAIAGGGGLLAALGPVGIALGVTALLAGGAWLAYEKFKGSADHVKGSLDGVNTSQGYVLQSTSFLTLAQEKQAQANDAVKQATDNLIQKQVQHSQAIRDNQQAYKDLRGAQDNVKQALDQFGQNSPQYQLAVKQLSDKQSSYDDQLLREWGLSADVSRGEQDLAAKRDALRSATGELIKTQDILNGGLGAGLDVIAKFGPTAANQVGAIGVLQNSISGVVGSWSNINISIQSQIPNLVGHLQGLSSTIQNVQGQNDNLNAALQKTTNMQMSVSGAGLQGGSGHLQNALGTDYSPGGMTLVGERGPELVNMPKGAKVYNDRDTKQMMTGGQTVNNYLSGQFSFSTKESVDAFFTRLDKTQRLAAMGMA